MAVDSLQISAETAEPEGRRDAGRPFEKGQSGNPAGRPLGRKNNATLAMQALLEGEAEALTRKAIALALEGNALALKLCLDRLAPVRRDRAVNFTLPAIANAEDLAAAMAAIAEATATGALTPAEALDLARVAAGFLDIIAARDAEDRRRRQAERDAAEAARRAARSHRTASAAEIKPSAASI